MGFTVLEHRVISSSSLLSSMETQEWRRQQCFSGMEAMPGLTHQGMLQGWNTPGLGSIIPASSVQRKGVQAWQLSQGGSGAPLPPPSARSSPEHCRPQEEL